MTSSQHRLFPVTADVDGRSQSSVQRLTTPGTASSAVLDTATVARLEECVSWHIPKFLEIANALSPELRPTVIRIAATQLIQELSAEDAEKLLAHIARRVIESRVVKPLER